MYIVSSSVRTKTLSIDLTIYFQSKYDIFLGIATKVIVYLWVRARPANVEVPIICIGCVILEYLFIDKMSGYAENVIPQTLDLHKYGFKRIFYERNHCCQESNCSGEQLCWLR